MPQQVYQMNTVVQFIVLKREGKWVVKSKDLERVFSVQREAVDAAIKLANGQWVRRACAALIV